MAERSAVVDSLVQASAGGAAACLTTLFLYPLDVVKTRLNRGADEEGVPYKGIGEVIERQTRKGIKGFYSGLQVRAPFHSARSALDEALGLGIVLERHGVVKTLCLRAWGSSTCCGCACGEKKEAEARPSEETRSPKPQVKLIQDILRSTSFFYMFTFVKKFYKRCAAPLDKFPITAEPTTNISTS